MTTTRSDTFSPDSIDQWKAHFDLHGYCILRDVLSKTVLLGAEAAAASLVDNLAERLIAQNLVKDTFKDAPFNERLSLLCATCPQMLPNLYRAELHQRKEFYDLLCHRPLLECVRHLLLPDVDGIRIFPNYSLRPKTKSALHEVTWHQDSGLRADGGPSTAPIEQRVDAFGLGRVVNCWTPLVPATIQNGAMKFIRGSQHRGILEHVFLGAYDGSTASGERLPSTSDVDTTQVAGGAQTVPAGSYKTGVRQDLISDDIESGKNVVDVECEPGDVVLFSNILVHRGGINSTDKIRWSLDWRFQDSSKSTYREEHGHVVDARTEKVENVCRDGVEWESRCLS